MTAATVEPEAEATGGGEPREGTRRTQRQPPTDRNLGRERGKRTVRGEGEADTNNVVGLKGGGNTTLDG